MNDEIRLVSEDGNELLLKEVMTIVLEYDIGDLKEGDEIVIYQDEDENYYPLISENDEESLVAVSDPEIINIINDTLEVLESSDEIV